MLEHCFLSNFEEKRSDTLRCLSLETSSSRPSFGFQSPLLEVGSTHLDRKRQAMGSPVVIDLKTAGKLTVQSVY